MNFSFPSQVNTLMLLDLSRIEVAIKIKDKPTQLHLMHANVCINLLISLRNVGFNN